jgi:hypothetical protein
MQVPLPGSHMCRGVCAGGTILDSHSSADPAVAKLGLVDRAITCPGGTVRMVFTPEPPQGGSWTIVSGTGPFEGLRGSGEFDVLRSRR